MGKKILFRADASPKIGIGHVMRSFALAQAWQDRGGQAVFLCAELPAKLESLLIKEKMQLIRQPNLIIGSLEDGQLTAGAAHHLGIEWIIADGYSFAARYQKSIKEQELKLLIVDDYGHSDYYAADIILNVGLAVSESLYSREPYTQLLLGSEYISLRREFLQKHVRPREIAGETNKILITMGGADPNQVTLKVIESLIKLNCNMYIKAVVGPAYNFIDKLKALSNSKVLLMEDVADMAALMAWADLAITAGGGTLAEMAYLGLPNIVVKTAANQYSCWLYEKKIGASLFLGDAQEITSEQISDCVKSLSLDYRKRRQMSANGRKLIDGQGSRRIFESMGHTGLKSV